MLNFNVSPMQTTKIQESKRQAQYMDQIITHITREKKDQPSKLVKESFAWLLHNKCKLIKAFKLHN